MHSSSIPNVASHGAITNVSDVGLAPLAAVPAQKISGNIIRQIVIEQSKRAYVGHIGSALSVSDIIASLYGDVLRADYSGKATIKHGEKDPERDRFVLSKGHAALALYAAFYLKGWITEAQLNSYCGDDSVLGVHPEHSLHCVDFATGSLGQGLSFGVGAALAAKLQKSQRRTYVLLSDAECNEGAVWEAVMFAAHHKLSSLTAILDLNGQQAFGYTKDVLDLAPMADRWKAFGWDVHQADGHDVEAMSKLIHSLPNNNGAPHIIIAKTTFGKGVSFMQHQIKWHYSPLSDDEYAQAMAELKAEGSQS